MPCRCSGWLRAFGRGVSQTAHLMVGLPDYDAYVAHRLANHPDEPVMSRAAFVRNRQDRRYGGGPDGVIRCC